MWTDFLFSIEVMRRRVARALARGTMLRWFSGLPIAPDAGPQKPGLLLLQIDGLSRRQFERAVASGKMPFLKKLLNREGYNLTTLYSGIPSTTPAVQAEIYYGVPCAVPAFGFLDREHKDFMLMKNIEAARRVEAEIKLRGGEPLLLGGSCWMNVYSGGAALEETHFSGVTFKASEMLKPRSLLRALLIAIIDLPGALWALLLTIGELFLGIWDMLRAVLAGENFLKELEFIISRVVVGAAIREVLVIGGTIDVNRGLPIVHINFLGYDERSHRRGPSTKFSHAELQRIDRAMRQLYRAAELSERRDYQVWVFSDHGHENARSYEQQVEGGIGQTVYEALKLIDAAPPGPSRVFCTPEYGSSWLGRRRVREHLEEQEQPDSAERWEENGFAVLARGPVGHLYLAKPLSLDRKMLLASHLVSNSRVPGVAFVTSKGKAVWVHPDGQVNLPEGAGAYFPHPEGIREELGRDLVRLCEHPNAGDLILFGWHPDQQPWTFPYERGAHAGPGLDETQGFCVLPASTRVPDGAVDFLRPSQFREAALHALGRSRIKGKPAAKTGTDTGRLRVMTYNIHSCIGLDGRLSCSRIVRAIRGFDPDIIALQEVDIERKRSRGENQVERIAAELEMHHAFCSTVESGREHYGHALLSRYPLELVACGHLGHPSRGKVEPRGALLARVTLHAGPVWIANTHLGLHGPERQAQVAELLSEAWLGRVPSDEPLIFCGDFNMIPGSAPYKLMVSKLRDVQNLAGLKRPLHTFVSTYPITRIDYVFVNDLVRVESLRAPRNGITAVASDHLPLIADLKIGPSRKDSEPMPHQQRNAHRGA